MDSFQAQIEIIGVNPYVLLPKAVLNNLFEQASRNKGPIQVKGKMNGVDFMQTLVKYSGQWRLYLNTPMRKSTNTVVGDTVEIEIDFDPVERTIPMNEKLAAALMNDRDANSVFESLSPSRQKEIVRYIGFLKTEESIDKNIGRVIRFLHGNERFVGRDKP